VSGPGSGDAVGAVKAVHEVFSPVVLCGLVILGRPELNAWRSMLPGSPFRMSPLMNAVAIQSAHEVLSCFDGDLGADLSI